MYIHVHIMYLIARFFQLHTFCLPERNRNNAIQYDSVQFMTIQHCSVLDNTSKYYITESTETNEMRTNKETANMYHREFQHDKHI